MTTKVPSILRFWSNGGKYDPDRIEYDKQLVNDYYNKNGFVNFAFIIMASVILVSSFATYWIINRKVI